MNIKTDEKGVSLLELMLAIAIFVVGSASVAHLFIGAQSAADYSVDKTQALFLARDGIEDMRAHRDVSFGNLENREGGHSETFILNDKEFDREVNVIYREEERYEVNSTVEWTSMNRTESITLTEYLTGWMEGEYDPDQNDE